MRWALALSISMILTACSSTPPEGGQIAIVGARLEAALDQEPIPYSVVVIEDGKIVAAGPQQTTPVPKGAQTVQGSGFVILPVPYNATIAPGEPANLMLRDVESRAPAEIMQNGKWVQ